MSLIGDQIISRIHREAPELLFVIAGHIDGFEKYVARFYCSRGACRLPWVIFAENYYFAIQAHCIDASDEEQMQILEAIRLMYVQVGDLLDSSKHPVNTASVQTNYLRSRLKNASEITKHMATSIKKYCSEIRQETDNLRVANGLPRYY